MTLLSRDLGRTSEAISPLAWPSHSISVLICDQLRKGNQQQRGTRTDPGPMALSQVNSLSLSPSTDIMEQE